MRKSNREAAETRSRIVQVAASEFRKNGVSGTGLNDLMAAAGLTHGGFYKHFQSKDQLVAEAYVVAGNQLTDSITAALAASHATESGLAGAAAAYLSTAHRDNPAQGCPLAALGSEIARCSEATRTAATESFSKFVDLIAAQAGDVSPVDARRQALVDACTMIGALTLSRVVNDPALADAILEHARMSLN